MMSRHLLLVLLCTLLSGHLYAEGSKKYRIRTKTAAKTQPKLTDVSLNDIQDADLYAAWDREKRTQWTMPGLGVSVPSGFGADWGTFYLGVSFASNVVNSTNNAKSADGVVFAGFGLGNSADLVGLDVSYAITDVDPFLADSTLSFRLHRYLGKGFGTSVGVESAFVFGQGIDGVQNYYLALSKSFTLRPGEFDWFSAAMLTAGVGTGRFRSWQDSLADKNSIGYFASAGLRVNAPLGVSLAWSGFGLDSGVSITPFRSFRLTVNMSYRNIVTSYAPGLSRAFDLSLVYGDSIFEDTFPFFSARANR